MEETSYKLFSFLTINGALGGMAMWKWLVGVSGVILIIGFTLYFWTGSLLEQGSEPKADGANAYAIILGAKVKANGVPSLSLQYRLDTALDYLQQYPHVQVIVSGGQGVDEPMSEAELMYTYLVEAGIDEERLIRENTSTSTYENLLFSKKLLPKGTNAVTIISSDFHLARAQYLAGKIELEVDVVAAKTPKVVEGKLRFRERLALLKTIIVGQ